MATRDEHLQQYRHNRKFVESITDEFPDWIVTGAFYCCVHLVDAVLAHVDNYHPVDHKTRNRALSRVTQLSFIARKYDPLYQLCRKVRYLEKPIEWVPSSQIDTNIFGRYLYPIEESAHRILQIDRVHTTISIRHA